MIYVKQWEVDSDTSNSTYIVSQLADGTFQCSCRGWTSHMPRRDCKHIIWCRYGNGGREIDPLAMAMIKCARKQARDKEKEKVGL